MSTSDRLLRKVRASIGAKIFGAFGVMSLITGAIGGYGIYELFTAAHIVVDTYDGSLMAINYARSANATFAQVDRDELLRRTAPIDRRDDIEKDIEQLLVSMSGDLDVARDRSRTDDTRHAAEGLKTEVATWDAQRRDAGGQADFEATTASILNHFDLLTELIADHGFIERRQAVGSIAYLEGTAVGALAAALLVGFIISYLLRRRIIRPLISAAGVADRISHGELSVQIPKGGIDETGVLLRSMGLMRDNIAAMMEHEAAQRRSAQTRLVDALESSREGMVLVGPDGRVVILNSEFARLFPSFSTEAASQGDFVASFDAAYPLWPGLLVAGGEIQLEDGRWLRCTRNPTQDGGFFLFFADFTEIKQREEKFKEAKLEAEAASRAKSTFLANMSHELRTPLNAIIGFSEVMSGAYFGPLGDARYSQYVNDIMSSGHHLLQIINSVLDLTKSDAGKLTLNVQDFDLGEVLEKCASLVRAQCEKNELTLRVDWPAEGIVVEGDAAKLRQALLNLLSNAVKFTPAGGKVWLMAREWMDDQVEIRITDTGIGVAPEDIAIALAPFGQVDSGLAREYEGTGLGLPLAKAFVDLHRGSLKIDSTVGQGTTVTVLLPKRISPQMGAVAAA